jgi:hypothetical protein
MRIVQNYKELLRAKRLASNNRLSYRSILNNGTPATQSLPVFYTPPPVPDNVPDNEMYTIAGDALKTIAGANLTTIS